MSKRNKKGGRPAGAPPFSLPSAVLRRLLGASPGLAGRDAEQRIRRAPPDRPVASDTIPRYARGDRGAHRGQERDRRSRDDPDDTINGADVLLHGSTSRERRYPAAPRRLCDQGDHAPERGSVTKSRMREGRRNQTEFLREISTRPFGRFSARRPPGNALPGAGRGNSRT
jgi:hypothetical protein